MKELYIAPALELLCLASAESLASDVGQEFDFDLLLAGPDTGVSAQDTDLDVPIQDVTK